MSVLCEGDVDAAGRQQAVLLRSGRLPAADVAHMAEESDSLGRREKREPVIGATALARHWRTRRHRPGQGGRGWTLSGDHARGTRPRPLADTPRLQSMLRVLAAAVSPARRQAASEAGLVRDALPPVCARRFGLAMDGTP